MVRSQFAPPLSTDAMRILSDHIERQRRGDRLAVVIDVLRQAADTVDEARHDAESKQTSVDWCYSEIDRLKAELAKAQAKT